jgi:hypothetical protein
MPKNGTKTNGRSSPSKRSDYLNSDEFILQPWFLPRRVEFAIRDVIPRHYRGRMRRFFDDYGCMICETEYRYGANGMCIDCSLRVRKKLLRSARRHSEGKPPRSFDPGIRKVKLAQALLRKFCPGIGAAPQRRRIDTARSKNPIDEALGPYSG